MEGPFPGAGRARGWGAALPKATVTRSRTRTSSHLAALALAALPACLVPRHGTEVPADPGRVLEASLAVLEELDYEVLDVDREEGTIVARSPEERRFFAMLGEQQKSTRVHVTLAPRAAGRRGPTTRVSLHLELLHGPAGGVPTDGASFSDPAWNDDFLERLERRLARSGGDAP
jgi:hypothetical protein